MTPSSVAGVVDVLQFRSAAPRAGARGLAIEVPHGAAGDWEFNSVATQLKGELPEGLIDFFHVNTDAGAAEIAVDLARRACDSGVVSSAIVVRCRIPRTFIDVNRVLGASRASYRAGGVTPGVPPWVTHPDDVSWLMGRYDAYQEVAKTVIDGACSEGGRAILLHTYAPRTVDVEVGPTIVSDLHAAYAPAVVERWPLRPEVDLIFRDPDGRRTLSDASVDSLRRNLAIEGLPLAEGATYPLHPVTTGYAHVAAHPGRVICVEVRRDLLTEAFVPFRQVQIDGPRVARVARAFAGWLAETA